MRARILKFCVCSLLTLILVLTIRTQVSGQNFPFITATVPSNQDTSWWDLNKAHPCGRMWCSHVFFPGGGLKGFTVAIAPSLDQDPAEAIKKVEARAKLIQKIYASIYETVLLKASISSEQLPKNVRVAAKLDWDDLLIQDNLSKNPSTPKIEVGVRNDQTVVYIPNQPELNLSQQPIVTVTEADALYYGETIPEVAQKWRGVIQDSLSSSLWGQVLDRQHPWVRPTIIALVLLLFLIPLVFSLFIRHFLRSYERRLRRKLQDIHQSLAQESMLWTEDYFSGSIVKDIWQSLKKARKVPFHHLPRYGWHLLRDNLFSLSSINRFGFLDQLHNFLELLLTTLFWAQIWLIFITLAALSLVYPQSRFFVLFFTRQAFILPLIWMVLALLTKIGGFIIDYLLSRWARDVQVLQPQSNRIRLRVSTYSPALKGAITFFLTVIGIYLTIQLCVRDPIAIASAGGVAVAVAFLSRNLLEDMLNGALILWSDRYAIGDYITVGEITGLVESMSLYATQIRGAEGRLVTIPNGKIFIVENLTKDWSRVELGIEIAEDADIDTAYKIIDRTAARLREDPEWKEKILEPASILGVETISSQGVLIKVWIKTQPAQQWSVGREFRARVKIALDTAGIALSVPRQRIISSRDEKSPATS